MRLLLIPASVLLIGAASCPPWNPTPGPTPTPIPTPTPTPEPTPPPGVPAKGQVVLLDLLLRQPDPPRLVRGGMPYEPYGAIQCCMPSDVQATTAKTTNVAKARRPLPLVFPKGSRTAEAFGSKAGGICNTMWPMASECWMDYTGAKGANFYHFRMGPFIGDADHESDWAQVGGPYLPGGLEWNPAFWQRVRELAWYAGNVRRSNVEVVVIDTWGCKVSQWGSDYLPWPAADIDACGRRPSSEQQRYLRKVVEELGQFGNVVWITGNESGEISGATQAWQDWVHAEIRSAEQAVGSGVVHLIGADDPMWASGPHDYVATHARAPLTIVAGKHTENNERNPHFEPEQEQDLFCRARAIGGHWWYWRGEQTFAQMDRTLALMGQGCGGAPVGCFPPPDDGNWTDLGAGGGTRADEVRAAQAALGSLCKSPPAHQHGIDAISALNTKLRSQGLCAGVVGSADAAMVQAEGDVRVWEEYHAVSPFDSGCWAGNPDFYPKTRWRYTGPWTQPVACGDPVPPTVWEWVVKVHTVGPNWTTVDATALVGPKAYCESIGFTDGRTRCPVRQEGAPDRSACERVSVGEPRWTGPGEVDVTNPYLYRVHRGVGGTVTVCASASPSVCGSLEVAP